MPRRLLGALTALAFALPFLIHWATGDQFQALRYLAGDSMYYHVVAMNTLDHGVLGYDQEVPSNGFHPLWQAMVVGLYAVARITADPRTSLIILSVFTCLVLMSISLYRLAEDFGARLPHAGWLVVVLPVGVYTLASAPLVGSRLTLWVQVSGMEAAVSLLAMALFAGEYLAHGLSRWRRIACWLALLVLSRLDTIFVLPALALTLLADRGRLPALIRIYATVAVVVLVYMAINLAYCGAAMPVSGVAKSTFPHPHFDGIGNAISAVLNPEYQHANRAFSVAFPLVLAAIMLPVFLTQVRQNRGLLSEILAVLLGFVVLRHLHDLLFIRVEHIGEWYYAPSQVILHLSVLTLADQAAAKRGWAAPRPRVALALAAVAIAAQCGFFAVIARGYRTRWTPEIAAFEVEADFRRHYAGNSPKFLAIDDGLTAFITGYPCMSGMGLNLDPAAARAFKQGTLVEHAYERGFDRISSIGYFDARRISREDFATTSEPAIRRWLAYRRLDVTGFDLEPDYLSDNRSLFTLRLKKR